IERPRELLAVRSRLRDCRARLFRPSPCFSRCDQTGHRDHGEGDEQVRPARRHRIVVFHATSAVVGPIDHDSTPRDSHALDPIPSGAQWKSRLPAELGWRRNWGTHRSSAIKCTTPDSTWSFPVTPRNGEVLTTTRCSSKTCFQTTRLTKPVSSSSVMKVTPAAVPGRCRLITTPAYRILVP